MKTLDEDGLERFKAFLADTEGEMPMHAEQRTIWRFHLIWWAWRMWVRVRYALTGDCGCACAYIEPYGWVPEAECPVHDVAQGGDKFGT